ncbi:MAG: homocysteine biosynthesis protein [Bacteroidota bacterium]
MKTFAEINERLRAGKAVVLTAEEVIPLVKEKGPRAVAAEVDVVTTATFGPMCSSGMFVNFGHSDPPIKMAKAWLNDVPVYAGVAAVDGYLGATELSETRGMEYGGAHVIEDLLAGKKIRLRATSYGTDCYPRREIETTVDLAHLNQAYLFNPRNAYQNYPVAVNSSARTIYTYMGTLLPHFGNATYSSAGELSPLLNDPLYRTIGVGTRVFIGGTIGYVAWEGTQHNPGQARADNGVPISGAGTLALIGNLKEMNRRYLRAAVFNRYGVTMYVGVGVPIPILDEEMARYVGVSNAEIRSTVVDYSVPSRTRPNFGQVTYAELRSGHLELEGRRIPTAPLSSLARAREIANILKDWLRNGRFLLQEPIQPLPAENRPQPLEDDGEERA